jgi:hypothetical protein
VKIETFKKKPAESIATRTSLARWIGYSWQIHTTAVRGNHLMSSASVHSSCQNLSAIQAECRPMCRTTPISARYKRGMTERRKGHREAQPFISYRDLAGCVVVHVLRVFFESFNSPPCTNTLTGNFAQGIRVHAVRRFSCGSEVVDK